MHLIGGQKMPRAERAGHARAVLAHMGRLVARANAAIEAGIDVAGYPAVPGEEGMTDVWRLERGGLEHHLRHAENSPLRLRVSNPGGRLPLALLPSPGGGGSAREARRGGVNASGTIRRARAPMMFEHLRLRNRRTVNGSV